MNTTDRLTSRAISLTVCLLGLLAVLALLYQVVNGYQVDGAVKELVALIVGGLLSRMTTTHANDGPIDANVTNTGVGEAIPVTTELGTSPATSN